MVFLLLLLLLPGDEKPKKRQWHLVKLDQSLYDIHLALIQQDFESIRRQLLGGLQTPPATEEDRSLDIVLDQDCYID